MLDTLRSYSTVTGVNIVKHFRAPQSEHLAAKQHRRCHRIVLFSLLIPGSTVAWLHDPKPQPVAIVSLRTLVVVMQILLAVLVRISPADSLEDYVRVLL